MSAEGLANGVERRDFMHKRRIVWLASPALLLNALFASAADKVEVKVAKYADLGKAIKDQKGKILVVDFWADY